jgi:predicted enzyme related to lactoylglutathione lyase
MNEGAGFEAIVEMGVVLPVVDMDRALGFYCDCLGFDFLYEEEDPADGRRQASVRYGNVVLDLVMNGDRPIGQNCRLFWRVEKLEEALRHLEAGGGRVVRYMEYGVYCTDPEGNSILVKLKDLDPEESQEFFF